MALRPSTLGLAQELWRAEGGSALVEGVLQQPQAGATQLQHALASAVLELQACRASSTAPSSGSLRLLAPPAGALQRHAARDYSAHSLGSTQ